MADRQRRTRAAAVAGIVCAVSVLAGAILAASTDQPRDDRTVATGTPGPADPWNLGNTAGAPSPIAADPSGTSTVAVAPGGDGPAAPPPAQGGQVAAHTHAPSPRPSPTGAAPPGPVGPVTRVYEAESGANTFAGGAAPSSCAACSGGGNVRWVGYSGTLQVNGVVSTAGGSAALTISYLNGDAQRWCLISVDGGNGSWISFPPTGSWTAVGSVTVTVGLRAGANRFLFAFSRNWCPDFDRFSVRG